LKKIILSGVALIAMSTFATAETYDAVGPNSYKESIFTGKTSNVSNEGVYAGIAWGFASIEADASRGTESANAEIDHDTAMYQIGYNFNSYIAIEGRYWDSMGEGDVSGSYSDSANPGNNFSVSGDVPTDFSAWGLYIKPMYPVTEAFTVYGLVGLVNVELEFDGLSEDDSSVQWGLGASYTFNNNVSMFLDYTKLYDEDEAVYDIAGNATMDSLNFGLNYRW
jgi:opacity protein-like surface antigen